MASLLNRARMLRQAALDSGTPKLLHGKNLGLLCDSPPDDAQALFHRCAEELGAHVAVMRPGLTAATAPEEVQAISRLIGRLYDGVECQCRGLSPELARSIAQHAGVPVFDGMAVQGHPCDYLADLLDVHGSRVDNQRFVLQAMLLEVIH